jgi:glucose/arabinose dehydrogenase
MKSIIIFSYMVLIMINTHILHSNPIKLEKISLPEGFVIEVYAGGLETARAIDFAPDGTLFVGSKNGAVYAIAKDRKVTIIDNNVLQPVGVDFYNGDLYVSAISKILKYSDILKKGNVPPEPVIITDRLPDDTWHGWKFIKIGPDNKLYVPVGAPCNVCLKGNPFYASILQMNTNGSDINVFASGIRNTVGFDWHPDTGDIWFTDNGRDNMGDTIPPDELNRASIQGLHFGFPYIHGSSIKDPQYYQKIPGNLKVTFPEYELPAHVAALGMRFYTDDTFPEKYHGGIFIAEHGSWNRSKKIGYRVSFISIKDNNAETYEVFAQGWLDGETAWGRPADVAVGPNGHLYVSDDRADCVYQIKYSP